MIDAGPPYGRSEFHLCALPRDARRFSSSGPRPAPQAIPTGSATSQGHDRRRTDRRHDVGFGLASCSQRSATLPGRTSYWLRRPGREIRAASRPDDPGGTPPTSRGFAQASQSRLIWD